MITKQMNRTAIAHLFWGAKIYIDEGNVRAARRVVLSLPEDHYEYAVKQSIYASPSPMKSLFSYVLKGIEPNHTGNWENEMEAHYKNIKSFSADTITD